MWSKQEQLSAVARARPLRVAYLVDLGDCPNGLLDAVFAEAYGRWGGRRTLIVPATADGIDPRYAQWLLYYDADILYSFLAFSDEVVAELHERYAPAHLVLNQEHRWKADKERSFNIELPVKGLNCLSVLPYFLSQTWGYDGPPRNIKVLTQHLERSQSPFLQESFGFLATSFAHGLNTSAFSDVFTGFSLITEATLADGRIGKDKTATYVTSEEQILEALAAPGGPLTVSQLSEYFAPYLESGFSDQDGTCLVVGDTPADRLIFWNADHRFNRGPFTEMTTLRLPVGRIDDDAFLERIRKLLRHRGARGRNNNHDHVNLHSCSIERSVLDDLAGRLRAGKMWLGVSVHRHTDHAALVPEFNGRDEPRFRFGGIMSEPAATATSEFQGSRVVLTMALPRHMKEAMPPAGLRAGSWMNDITLDRLNDHCAYVNQRHIWELPRRLRLERAFKLEQEGGRDHDLDARFIRPMRRGELGVVLNAAITRSILTVPDDVDALRTAMCSEWEWVPFDRGRKDAPHGRNRFAAAEISDKGRYLIGVLQLFERVPDAFVVVMHDFWRTTLHELGGVTSERETATRDELIRVLRKRTGQLDGPLTFENAEQLDRLAREAIRAGRMIGRERRHIGYRQLHARWLAGVNDYVARHPSSGAHDKDEDLRDPLYLDRSVQFLCQREVLFQGREWRCRTCYNRNWIGIGDLKRTMTCAVCGRDEPAPVSDHWQFRANPFLLEAYRDHGTEALVWSLWQLWKQARSSYYFVPSLKLWLSYPESSRTPCDVEVDAVAVVDGRVHLVEAKTTGGLDDGEIGQLQLAAQYIRPDVVVLASLEPDNTATQRAAVRLRAGLGAGIEVAVLNFRDGELDRAPFLPC